MVEHTTVKNPWIIFYQNRGKIPQVGYVTSEIKGILEVLESETQDLPRAYLSSKNVERAPTIDVMVENLSRKTGKSFDKILSEIEENFPSEF